MFYFNMLIYIKYELGEEIVLGMIKKDNVLKNDIEILFWSFLEVIVKFLIIMI